MREEQDSFPRIVGKRQILRGSGGPSTSAGYLFDATLLVHAYHSTVIAANPYPVIDNLDIVQADFDKVGIDCPAITAIERQEHLAIVTDCNTLKRCEESDCRKILIGQSPLLLP
jgi:hypothetical protein